VRILSRTIFREIVVSATLGTVLFTFVLFLYRAGTLFEFLVRNSGPLSTVLRLFALVLPQALPFTIPLGVLVGTLITLSRMSSDGEITAMRAAGMPGRRVAPPLLTFGFIAMLAAAAASLWLTPWSIRERYRIQNQLIASQLTTDIQPRVFEEQFPNRIVYVSDVVTGVASRWRRIFIADITPPGERTTSDTERGETPSITLATEAVAQADSVGNRIQLALKNKSTYETDKDPKLYHIQSEPVGDRALQAQKRNEVAPTKPTTEMDTLPLYRLAYRDKTAEKPRVLEARIELHNRLALPFACLLLALAGIPLGVTTRRAGKSGAVVMSVGLAFLYDMGLISMISMARQGTLPPGIALWIPNAIFLIFGVVMMARLESPGDRDFIGALAAGMRRLRNAPRKLERFQPKFWLARFPLLPQVVDRYILTSFLYYFVLLLVSFVLMTHVYTFFELLSDIVKNGTPLSHIFSYHLFLTARLVYQFTPIAVLAAVLVVFGVLTKHNEVTAFKASGISVYRLSVPVLVASACLSGGLFAFDHFWVPEADRRQDALRAEIKGKPAQTFLRPDRKWMYGQHDRIYYYTYFDPSKQVMAGVNVYEIDPQRFRLKRHIYAESARWSPILKKWDFQNGWSRDMEGNNVTHYESFAGGTKTFDELEEDPGYFVREVIQSQQMNYQELEAYIQDLQQKGFDTVALQVQYHKKFSVPLFAMIMAMVSIPFAFLAGNRGAMAGVGISLALAIAYWSVGQLFEQIGNLSQLPAQIAAWSPDAVFALAGLYFLARMRT
jgi:LPS export ABC transporter permease LptF/LPS export ABC transporter permease LptG